MKYTKERICALAQIARIAVTDEEAERLCSELDEMQRFADVLQNAPQEADREDPFLDAVDMDALRPDGTETSLPGEEALAAAPMSRDGYFLVPRVLEE